MSHEPLSAEDNPDESPYMGDSYNYRHTFCVDLERYMKCTSLAPLGKLVLRKAQTGHMPVVLVVDAFTKTCYAAEVPGAIEGHTPTRFSHSPSAERVRELVCGDHPFLKQNVASLAVDVGYDANENKRRYFSIVCVEPYRFLADDLDAMSAGVDITTPAMPGASIVFNENEGASESHTQLAMGRCAIFSSLVTMANLQSGEVHSVVAVELPDKKGELPAALQEMLTSVKFFDKEDRLDQVMKALKLVPAPEEELELLEGVQTADVSL